MPNEKIHFGIRCVARYDESQFRSFEGRDKSPEGLKMNRRRLYRSLTHRFKIPGENGSEIIQVTEFLPDTAVVKSLAECKVAFKPGQVYELALVGLESSNGALSARINPLLTKEVVA